MATKEDAIRGPRHAQWKGDAAGLAAKYKRANRLFTLGPCQRCGKPGIDRHHIDANPGNNVPSNIMILCRYCHMEIDGRMERNRTSGARRGKLLSRPPKPCIRCGRPFKPLRKGRCGACAEYFRTKGVERPIA